MSLLSECLPTLLRLIFVETFHAVASEFLYTYTQNHYSLASFAAHRLGFQCLEYRAPVTTDDASSFNPSQLSINTTSAC